MRTTSRWPCATRRRISPSTAAALRLRVAPRTSGITQKAQEKRAAVLDLHERADAVESCVGLDAADRADVAGDRLDGFLDLARTTVTFCGQPRERSPSRVVRRSRSRRRAACVRAARDAAWRDFARPSLVTQHVFTTATSPGPSPRHGRRASRRSRNACASVCETLQPRKPTVKLAMRRELYSRDGAVGRPAALLDAPLDAIAVDRRLVRDEVAGGDHRARRGSRPESMTTASAAMFASARSAVGSASCGGPPAGPRRDAVVGRVPRRDLDRLRVEVDGHHRREAELHRGDREHPRAAADVEQAAALLGFQQLEAEAGRRVAARPERAAGVDHDGERVASGCSHGGPIQRLPTRTGRWNCAPAVLPVVPDLGGRCAAEGLPDALLPAAFVYAASSTPPSPSTSSKPSGKSSSMTARAGSARAAGPLIETRLRMLSGARF